jgi:hypothetical protein
VHVYVYTVGRAEILPNKKGGKDVTQDKYCHEPRLDTILMVEKAIKESGSYPTKKELLASLPRKIQYQTFVRILEYLESSNKIVLNSRHIIWVFPDNPKLKNLLETSVKLRSSK